MKTNGTNGTTQRTLADVATVNVVGLTPAIASLAERVEMLRAELHDATNALAVHLESLNQQREAILDTLSPGRAARRAARKERQARQLDERIANAAQYARERRMAKIDRPAGCACQHCIEMAGMIADAFPTTFADMSAD